MAYGLNYCTSSAKGMEKYGMEEGYHTKIIVCQLIILMV